MEVELDDALLTAQPCEELAILAICALGWAKRHRVLPRSEAAWDAWAGTLPPDLKDQVKNVWKEGRGAPRRGRPRSRFAWFRPARTGSTSSRSSLPRARR